MDDAISRLNAALLGRYRIERNLGEGGMATIYLAEDLRHGRAVAVKVLRPELAAFVGADRFIAEIRTTARLQHPHILPLFDSGEAAGLLYYVMPLVDGESLRQRLDRERQLPVDEAVRIAGTVASALEHAHRLGVLHRDIKPENILLRDGEALVADFGIALTQPADPARLTGTGVSLGTPTYMSPEQMTGDRELDARTDVYSLACVLYEMLSGDPPHQARTPQALTAKVLTEASTPIAKLRPSVPAHVAAAIERALAKAPADRFRTAAEFDEALAGRLVEPTAVTGGLRLAGAAAIAGAILLSGWALLGLLDEQGEANDTGVTAGASPPAVAVLPFAVSGTGVELQPADLVELLTINLDGLAGLRPVSARTVLERWRERVGESGSVDLETMLAIAGNAGARYAVIGSAVGAGSVIRLAATTHDLTSGEETGGQSVEGPADSVLALVDRLTIAILPTLVGETRESPAPRLVSVTTSSVPALRAYLEGMALARQRQQPADRPYFERAVALDSMFALAWLRLASDSESDAHLRAVSLISRLPPREATLVRITDAFRRGRLEDTGLLQRAAAAYPDDSDIWLRVADFLYHFGSQALLERDESIRAFEYAIELDPTLLTSYEHVVDDAINSGDLARAEALAVDYARHGGPEFYRRIWRLQLAALGSTLPAPEAVAAVLDTVPDPPFGGSQGGRPENLVTLYPYCPGGYCARSRDIWPRLLDVRQALLEAWIQRPGYPPQASTDLAITTLVRGRVRDARAALERDPRVTSLNRAMIHHRLWSIGHPLSPEVYERELSVADADTLAPIRALVTGAYAADVGGWDAFARAQGIVQRSSVSARASGDTLRAEITDHIARALAAYGGARQGRRVEALAELEAVRASVDMRLGGDLLSSIVRWWLGDFSASEGRNQDALRYFRSFAQDPIGQLMLGRVYESLGDNAAARRSYALALECWRDADPDFPLLEEARVAVARLGEVG